MALGGNLPGVPLFIRILVALSEPFWRSLQNHHESGGRAIKPGYVVRLRLSLRGVRPADLFREVVWSESSRTGIVNWSLDRFAAFLLAMMRSKPSTLSRKAPSRTSTQWRSSSRNFPSPSIRRTMSNNSVPAPANIGGLRIGGGTYAAPTSRKAFVKRGSCKFSNHKSTSCVTTGAP